MIMYHCYYSNYFSFVIITVALLSFVASAQQQQDENDSTMIYLLFVGNSYTISNNLQNMVKRMMDEYFDGIADVNTSRLASGGRRFTHHVETLPDAMARRPYYNYVILQDQSQVPGLYVVEDIFDPSVDAVIALDEMIQNYNNNADAGIADTILFQTWGRQRGDGQNPELFPDFLTMNERIRDGYHIYHEAITTDERPVYIAPVGDAFEIVYDDSDGGGSDFDDLYSDGSHPSIKGTFLAANVIYATLTCGDPTQLQWAPDSVDNASYLRSVAQDKL